VAYFGNEPDRLECALFPARLALYARMAEHRSGWGLGFVQGGDVLLQKRPRADTTEVDLFGLAKELKSADALIGRVGLDEEARTSAQNADPFRFRAWLFGSIGETPGFSQICERLLQSVPDFLRRNIRGRSASEHMFHLFLAFLHDAGLLEAASLEVESVERAMRESLTFVGRLLADAGCPPPKVALIATNGRCMVAESHGEPIQFLQIPGIPDCTVCRDRDPSGTHDRRVAHEALRAVIVEVNHAAAPRPGWSQMLEGRALVAGADRIARVL